ncbi:hypothetical protein TNCV_1383891 [Trichonephila clavipes]|nr:hypothetical protein TNCV_1383891 [Trichonephila clavipes]
MIRVSGGVPTSLEPIPMSGKQLIVEGLGQMCGNGTSGLGSTDPNTSSEHNQSGLTDELLAQLTTQLPSC